MPCPYGCRPEGGLLPDSEGKRLLMEAERIGGSDSEAFAQLVGEMLALLDRRP